MMRNKMNNQQIEKYAIRVALGNNGGQWSTHYTEKQKQHWRTFIIDLIKDIKDEQLSEV